MHPNARCVLHKLSVTSEGIRVILPILLPIIHSLFWGVMSFDWRTARGFLKALFNLRTCQSLPGKAFLGPSINYVPSFYCSFFDPFLPMFCFYWLLYHSKTQCTPSPCHLFFTTMNHQIFVNIWPLKYGNIIYGRPISSYSCDKIEGLKSAYVHNKDA